MVRKATKKLGYHRHQKRHYKKIDGKFCYFGDSPYKAIVSVMMLKEGWDVRNVTTIVGFPTIQESSTGISLRIGPGFLLQPDHLIPLAITQFRKTLTRPQYWEHSAANDEQLGS